jgi:hypothetical protein
LRIQFAEFFWRRRRVRRRRTVRIIALPRHHPRAIYVRGWRPARVRIRWTVRARVLPFVLRPPRFLLLSALLPLFLSLLPRRLLSWRLLPRWLALPPWWLALLLGRLIILSILPPIRARSLRKRRYSQRRTHPQHRQPSRELESRSHLPLHLLILLNRFVGLHRWRQFS